MRIHSLFREVALSKFRPQSGEPSLLDKYLKDYQKVLPHANRKQGNLGPAPSVSAHCLSLLTKRRTNNFRSFYWRPSLFKPLTFPPLVKILLRVHFRVRGPIPDSFPKLSDSFKSLMNRIGYGPFFLISIVKNSMATNRRLWPKPPKSVLIRSSQMVSPLLNSVQFFFPFQLQHLGFNVP